MEPKYNPGAGIESRVVWILGNERNRGISLDGIRGFTILEGSIAKNASPGRPGQRKEREGFQQFH